VLVTGPQLARQFGMSALRWLVACVLVVGIAWAVEHGVNLLVPAVVALAILVAALTATALDNTQRKITNRSCHARPTRP
jgi:hypothetical protein